MSGKPVARLGDRTDHRGTIVTASGKISANRRKIARVGDIVSCPRCGRNPIVSGVEGVFGEGKMMAVVGSRTACGSTIISGSPNVFIGSKRADGGTAELDTLQIFDEQFRIYDPETGEPMEGVKYEIVTGSGISIRGVTGKDGLTRRVYTGDETESAALHYKES